MGDFLIILFLLFLFYFIVLPIIRGARTVNRLRRQTREAFENAFQQQREQQRKGGWSSAERHKSKKIGKDVGEYVAYEEISETRHVEVSTDGQTASFTAEQQIVDAEWEEVKP